MPVLRIQLDASSDARLRRLERPQVWLTRALGDIAEVLAELTAQEAREIAPRDTGRSIDTIRARRVTTNVSEVQANLPLIVIDRGRRPGAPGPSPRHLEGWVARGIGRGRLSVKVAQQRQIAVQGIRYAIRKRRGGKLPPYAAIEQWAAARNIRANRRQQVQALSFAIARSIHVKGIKGRKFFLQSYVNVLQDGQWQRRAREIIQREFRRGQ